MALTASGAPVELVGGIALVGSTGADVIEIGDGLGYVAATGEMVFFDESDGDGGAILKAARRIIRLATMLVAYRPNYVPWDYPADKRRA